MRDRKIAFAHYGAANDISGVTTWLERFLIRLNREGYRPIVLLHHFGSEVRDASILGPLLNAGIKVEIIPRGSSIAQDVRSTLAFLNRHKPTAFVPQCLSAFHIAAGIAGRQGLPWAMTIHSDDPEYWAIAESIRPEGNNGKVVGVSEYISQSAIDRGLASHPETIPCGVAITAGSAMFSDTPFRIAFTGRLVEEQKRISLVVAAMVEACRRDTRIQCLIFGDGTARPSAMRTVNESGLEDRIRFLGRLPPADVRAQLGQCQALLLMSDFEGLPVSILEAMAIGVVPVVRGIRSGVPELVEDGKTGLLVSDKPEDAATAIMRLADDPALWRQSSAGAKNLIEARFNEDVCYRRWTGLLNELCQASGARYPISAPRGLQFRRFPPLLLNRYTKPPPLGHRIRRKLAVAARAAGLLAQASH